MNSKHTSDEYVGLIGGGSFGAAIANIVAENRKVLLFSRRQEVANAILNKAPYRGGVMHPNIEPARSMEEIAEKCTIIMPAVSAKAFRSVIRQMAHVLRPDHILIHCTKGLDVMLAEGETLDSITKLQRDQVKTMSEVILEESSVVRVGCLSGPNLAAELRKRQPAATVLASPFEEVVREGRDILMTDWFRVYKSDELRGVELAGVLKNIMAIMSGMLEGLGYGYNTKALLIARGMVEMVDIGHKFNINPKAFVGLAGVGDLVATCSSSKSRNFTFGNRLSKGETFDEVLHDMNEVVEGIHTTRIINALASYYQIEAPITSVLYRVLFQGMPIKEAQLELMQYRFTRDVAFI